MQRDDERPVPRWLRQFVWYDSDLDHYTSSPVLDFSLKHPPLPQVPHDIMTNEAFTSTITNNPSLFKVVTPLNVSRLMSLLSDHPNRPFVESVGRALREGFWPWATIPDNYPTTWDNSYRPLNDPAANAAIDADIAAEVASGRYSEPFGPDLLPGMFSAPIHTVPKPRTNPPKLRVVHDHSAGEFSCNSMVPRCERSGPLDTVQHLGCKIRRLRRELGPQRRLLVWKSDVSMAYRLAPMHPMWQLKQVVSWKGSRMINRANIWGFCAAGHILAVILCLVVWIALHLYQIDPKMFVDDAFDVTPADDLDLYEPYNKIMPRSQAIFLRLWDDVGIPHSPSKQMHGPSLVITGFSVDPNEMTITMDKERKLELLEEISNFASTSRRSLREFQRLTGWLNWAITVMPVLRPALACLYEKMKGKSKPMQPMWINNKIRTNLRWFHDHFSSNSGVFLLESVAWSVDDADLVLYGDACPSGLGFYSQALAKGFWCYPPMPISCDIYFLESFAILCQILWATRLTPKPKRLIIYSDNTNAVAMFNSLRGEGMNNGILILASELLMSSGIDLRVLWLRGSSNPIADALSRFKFELLPTHISVTEFKPPERWIETIYESAPLTRSTAPSS